MSETPWKRAAAQWHPLVCLMLLTGFAGLRAEPVIFLRAIVNAASFMPSGVPGGAIARGSIFTIFGRGIGPATSATGSCEKINLPQNPVRQTKDLARRKEVERQLIHSFLSPIPGSDLLSPTLIGADRDRVDTSPA